MGCDCRWAMAMTQRLWPTNMGHGLWPWPDDHFQLLLFFEGQKQECTVHSYPWMSINLTRYDGLPWRKRHPPQRCRRCAREDSKPTQVHVGTQCYGCDVAQGQPRFWDRRCNNADCERNARHHFELAQPSVSRAIAPHPHSAPLARTNACPYERNESDAPVTEMERNP